MSHYLIGTFQQAKASSWKAFSVIYLTYRRIKLQKILLSGLQYNTTSDRKPTTQISQTPRHRKFHFHGKIEMPWGLLLLQAPVLWLSGLPGPPEDSLRVPRDGGLLGPVVPSAGANFVNADKGSIWFANLDSLRPSEMKLATTTWRTSQSLALAITNLHNPRLK